MRVPELRAAIVAGLSGRPAFTDVDLFAYPASGFAERGAGFELGPIRAAASDDVDFAALDHLVEYELLGMVWAADSGADDEDFTAAETEAIGMLRDLQAWLVSVDHGKTLAGVDVDYVELASWEESLTAEPGAVFDFVLAVREVV